MKLSIVTTLYHSAAYIEEFHRRISTVALQYVGDAYEIIMVDDGSPDNSLEVAVRVAEQDSHVKVVELSRNFGHHKAMMTGLMQATGEEIFLIDVDLEEEPEWLIPFAEEKAKCGVDVVYGVQKSRKGGWFERVSGELFYKTFNALMEYKIPQNMVVARLMSKKYKDALTLHNEYELFMGGICAITGFKQIPFTVVKHSTSETTYTFSKKISQAANAALAFSSSPLKYIFYLGLIISLLAGLYIVNIVISYLFIEDPVDGWASLIATVCFFGGMTFAALGLIGVYIAKIFNEVKNRPFTIIKEVHSNTKDLSGKSESL